MQGVLTILIAGIFTDNFILSRFLGVCPFLGVSKRLDTAVGMSLAVTLVMVLATAITFPLYVEILTPLGLGYLRVVVFILIIAAIVQLLEIILKKYLPPLYNALGIFLPLITTNCAVLGVTLLHFTHGHNYLEALLSALAAGTGFLVAMVMFAGVRSRIEGCDIPKSLQGLPITLIAAGIMSLSFMGFVGIAEGIFGR
jgi:electron transport complex protein RnfA